MGVRKINKPGVERVTPIEHPDGGTFHVRELGAEDQVVLEQLSGATELARGPEGEVLYNTKTGAPSYRSAVNNLELAREVRGRLLVRISDLETIEGERIELAPEATEESSPINDAIDSMLLETVTVPLPEEIAKDRAVKTRTLYTYAWLYERAKALRFSREQVEAKN